MNEESDNKDRMVNDDVNRVEQETVGQDQPSQTTEYKSPADQAVHQPTVGQEPKHPAGVNKAVWIVLVVLALLIGGGLGYIFGNNFATTNNSEVAVLQQQVNSLESQLDDAKNDLEEAKSDTTSTDNIVELEKTNAALQQQVDDLEDQVSDLEQKLEDAQNEADSQDTSQ